MHRLKLLVLLKRVEREHTRFKYGSHSGFVQLSYGQTNGSGITTLTHLSCPLTWEKVLTSTKSTLIAMEISSKRCGIRDWV
jgi:hypothetical protein